MKKVFSILFLTTLVLAQASVSCPFDGAPAHLVSKVNHGLMADCTYEHQYWDSASSSWKTHRFSQTCDGTQ